jgi:hypothetical integral membrane protein (TIGR02206 family)
VRQFSVAHLAALGVLLAAAVVVVAGPRVRPGRGWLTWVAPVLAAIVALGWLGEYVADVVQGIWTIRYSLPLQLTDAASLAAIVALLTRARLAIELLYFWSLSASLQAIVTPDLGRTFPSVYYFTYFAYHIGAVLGALLLVFGCGLYPRRRAILWVFPLTLGWTAIAGSGDVLTQGNYMYLHFKPAHNSLLNVMGPWPWYIASGVGIAVVLFGVLQALANFLAARDGKVASRGRLAPAI